MNVIETLVSLFFVIVIAQISHSIGKLADNKSLDVNTVLFIFYFILFRTKRYLDDLAISRNILNDTNKAPLTYIFMLLCGIITFIFWILAAMYIGELRFDTAYIMIMIAISIDTLYVLSFSIVNKWHFLWCNILYISLAYIAFSHPIAAQLYLIAVTIVDWSIIRPHEIDKRS